MKKIIFLLVMVTTIVACSKSTESTQPPLSGPYFPAVRTIIQNSCLGCHSPNGNWVGRPVDLSTDSMIVKYATAIDINVVSKTMPQGSSLSQSDINTIVAWYQKGGRATD